MTEAMTWDALRDALRDPSDGADLARAFAEAPGHAGEIAAETGALLTRLLAGAWLVPAEEAFVLRGLTIAAAAGRPELFGPWIDFLGGPDPALAAILGEALSPAAAKVTLSLFPPGDAAAAARIVALVEDDAVHPEARQGLWLALARLLAAGAASRPRVRAAFDAAALEADAEGASAPAFWGWANALALLGDARDTARLAALDGVAGEALQALHAAHADRDGSAEDDDLARFDEAGVAPIENAHAAYLEFAPSGPGVPGLSPREFAWLDAYLASGEAGEAAFDLEAAEGFFTALAIGPSRIEADAAAAAVLGSLGGAGEPAALEAARSALGRRFEAVCASVGQAPVLLDDAPEAAGGAFAWGYLEAVSRDEDAWAEIWRDAAGGPAMAALQTIESDEPTRSERKALVDRLPEFLRDIARYWADPSARRARAPLRAVKIGRNDPCPCGSGKKYKQCCLGAP